MATLPQTSSGTPSSPRPEKPIHNPRSGHTAPTSAGSSPSSETLRSYRGLSASPQPSAPPPESRQPDPPAPEPVSPSPVSQPAASRAKQISYRGVTINSASPPPEKQASDVEEAKKSTSSGAFAALNRLFGRSGSPQAEDPPTSGSTYRGRPVNSGSMTYRGQPIAARQTIPPVSDGTADQFRGFFEHAPVGMFQTTLDGTYINANPALARLYGYDSPQELLTTLTRISSQLYVDSNRRDEFKRLLLAQEAVFNFESQIYRKDGRTIWITEDARVIRDPQGKITGFEGTVRELTEQLDNPALLGQRYKLLHALSAGGFGETYMAEDMHRPNRPSCVVKKLQVGNKDPKFLKMARRLFNTEAEILEKLGKHDQIPQLLAYFEQDHTFYLVQEFIEGHSLESEFYKAGQLPETEVIGILQDLMQILVYVHSQDVIHRDIKPSNIIRRRHDHRLVLIDFGAVKQFGSEVSAERPTGGTIAVGTPGYMPIEQCAGRPRVVSDIYAVGVLAIQALTGLRPEKLQHDPKTDEILWRQNCQVSGALANLLDKMVRYHFADRYQSALEVLQALQHLGPPSQ
ncbi:MAG: protein kinase [Synechococcaceae cyanobacterium SM2_3_1]|nr:protein kinase [Synechococcaceae cyanobacterium SM2_3_1]